MGQATDFDKLRRKRRRGRLIRRIAVLVAVLLGALIVLSLNDMLVDVGVLHYINDFFADFGGDGYPIPAPGGTLRDAKSLGANIAILNDTNLFIYNKRGKELQGVQRMNDGTILLTAGGRALTYDVGSARFRLFSRSNILLEGESEYAITSAALGRKGNYAIVTSHKQFTAQATVFDPAFELEFQWSSNELVAGLALSPDGDSMAAGCVGAQGGVLCSTVLLFSFDRQNEIARLEFMDELLLHLEYVSDKKVGVLTDRGYHIMDDTGKLAASRSFGGERLVESRFEGGAALLLCENPESRTQTIILLDKNGAELGVLRTGIRVRDMQLGAREVYLLTEEGIAVYDMELSHKQTVEAGGVMRILLAADTLYCLTPEQIYIVDTGTNQN